MDINETVTKEQALKLKELGFKEVCLFGLNREGKRYLNGYCNNSEGVTFVANTGLIPAPSYPQAIEFCLSFMEFKQITINKTYDSSFRIGFYNGPEEKEPTYYFNSDSELLDKLLMFLEITVQTIKDSKDE